MAKEVLRVERVQDAKENVLECLVTWRLFYVYLYMRYSVCLRNVGGGVSHLSKGYVRQVFVFFLFSRCMRLLDAGMNVCGNVVGTQVWDDG